MFLCLPVGLYYQDGTWSAFLGAGGFTFSTGAILWLLTKKDENKELGKREGYLIVTLGWISMSLFGSLPYFLTNSVPVYTDALFETMSGFTTTGATILNNIESMPEGILFWRSLTQWIGGDGYHCSGCSYITDPGNWGNAAFCSRSARDIS